MSLPWSRRWEEGTSRRAHGMRRERKPVIGRSDGLPHASVATFELGNALGEWGCPVCRVTRRAAERWVWTLLYEHSGDPAVHQAMAETGGVCAAHGDLVQRVVAGRQLASSGAVARLYHTVVDAVRQRLDEGSRKVSGSRCPLCVREQEMGKHAAGILAEALKDVAWQEAYAESDGVCLPHLELCLAALRGRQRSWLRQDARQRLDALQYRLSEYCRKQRYDVDACITDEESDSWNEALWRVGGMWSDTLLVRDDH